jgi:succinate-acetate transporter protein
MLLAGRRRGSSVDETDPQKKLEGMTRIVLRPLASPLPLAFFAFGAGSLLLSGLQLGLIPTSETRSVALAQAAFVFPPLALSSVLAYLSRETLGATIMALISFSWLANGLIDLTTPPSSTNATQGLLALSLAAILLLVGVSAVLGKPLLGLVIALASARFATTGLYEMAGVTTLQTASGVLGCLIAAIALYGGLALGLEDLQGKTVLPIGRRGAARRAFEGDLGEQVGPVESEAGVRKQL